MLETARNSAPASYELSGAHQRHVRSDRGDQAERQILALEMIAAGLSRIAVPQETSCQVMTYEEAAAALAVSTDLLGKMVADGRLKQGRHYIELGTNKRFAKNLADLIFEDQLSLDDVALAPATAGLQPKNSVRGAGLQTPKISRQVKLPNQNQNRAASKNCAGLDVSRERSAS